MGLSAFSDKQQPLTMVQIFTSIGDQRPVWEHLVRYLTENFGVKDELKFYGKKLGWALRFRKSGNALLSLYPGDGTITVQLVLSENSIAAATKLAIDTKIKQVIESAHPYPEGRWLFIPIHSSRDVEDIKHLLALKIKPVRQSV